MYYVSKSREQKNIYFSFFFLLTTNGEHFSIENSKGELFSTEKVTYEQFSIETSQLRLFSL